MSHQQELSSSKWLKKYVAKSYLQGMKMYGSLPTTLAI